jgi:DNA-directed RNA polymerase specialized sigma subunit
MCIFSDLEISVLEMYFQDSMKEREIAASLGIELSMVHEVLANYENADVDAAEYAEASADADAEHYGLMG